MKTLPAFPTDPKSHNECDTGMTLRDYFAAKALSSLLSIKEYENSSFQDIADMAYIAADAMMTARVNDET